MIKLKCLERTMFSNGRKTISKMISRRTKRQTNYLNETEISFLGLKSSLNEWIWSGWHSFGEGKAIFSIYLLYSLNIKFWFKLWLYNIFHLSCDFMLITVDHYLFIWCVFNFIFEDYPWLKEIRRGGGGSDNHLIKTSL